MKSNDDTIQKLDGQLRNNLNFVLMNLEQIVEGYHSQEETNLPKKVSDELNNIIEVVRNSFNLIEERAIKENLMLKKMLTKEQAMAALGRLSGRIAHDMNNILSGFALGFQLLELELEKDETEKEEMVEIIESLINTTEFGKNMVKNLLLFNRSQGKNSYEFCSPESIISIPLDILKKDFKNKSIIIKKTINPKVEKIFCDKGKIAQLFLNLLVNARDALEKNGGEIEIKVDDDENNITLSVSDNGCGIPEENLEKIFEPLYTTKPEGKGTGIGMYIVKNIVNEHNGSIKILSKINRGTNIAISLPKKLI
jgi:signal transduction histidine kinase